MANSNQANDVATYAAAVRTALASLPESERASLLEDLENHLAEVAGESDLSLQERLGKPEDYAAELRSAYGFASTAPNMKHGWPLRQRSSALLKAAFGTQVYRELRALLPDLLPGWWVLRAYLLVLVLAFMFRGESNLRPIPNPFSSGGLLQILATLVAIYLSVRLGRRGLPVKGGWRGAALAVNVGIALFAFPVLVSMGTGDRYAYSYADTSDPYFSSVSAGYYAGLTNIYPYSKDGKALKDVLLYDQDGHPLIPTAGKDVVTDVPTGSDGLPIPNAYPLNQRDSNGLPVLPPRVALPPWPAAAPGASPTPTP
jgi:HAAS domain-containing protein